MKAVYCEFRLCITTANFGSRKGIGPCPYPYATGVTFHYYRKDIRMNNQSKDHIISFRVTDEEKKWIEDHSYGNYRLVSDFVRDCVFGKDIVIINGLDEFSEELRRIGNNLNQLTRAVNSGYAKAVDITETKEEVEKLWQLLNSLLRDAR